MAISQPQILTIAAPQAVRTVIARPITVARVSPGAVARAVLRPSQPPPIALTLSQPAPQPITLVQAQPQPTLTLTAVPVAAAAAPVDETPKAYSFGYETEHDDGSTSTRQESSDANGAVRGSYSYRDADGLFRTVDYVADENGFRATVRSNEPGMARGDPDPADVNLEVEPVPDNVVQKYSSQRLQSTARTVTPIVVRTVAAAAPPAPQQIQIVRAVAAPQQQPPQTIRLQAVSAPQTTRTVQAIRVQAAPQQQPPQTIRLIPVQGIIGGSGFQTPSASNLILLNSIG